MLAKNLGKPVTREQILKDIWAGQSGGSHALDTHLWRLRRKLGDADETAPWIENVPGIGYILHVPD